MGSVSPHSLCRLCAPRTYCPARGLPRPGVGRGLLLERRADCALLGSPVRPLARGASGAPTLGARPLDPIRARSPGGHAPHRLESRCHPTSHHCRPNGWSAGNDGNGLRALNCWAPSLMAGPMGFGTAPTEHSPSIRGAFLSNGIREPRIFAGPSCLAPCEAGLTRKHLQNSHPRAGWAREFWSGFREARRDGRPPRPRVAPLEVGVRENILQNSWRWLVCRANFGADMLT